MPQLRFKYVLKRDLVAYRIAVELLRQNDPTAGSVELKRKVTAQQSQSEDCERRRVHHLIQRWKRTPSFLDCGPMARRMFVPMTIFVEYLNLNKNTVKGCNRWVDLPNYIYCIKTS